MKNLFLSVVLLLTVSFAFANNDVEKVSTFNVEETIELVNSIEFADADFSMEIKNSLETVGTCYITLGFYGEDGEYLGGVVLEITGVGSAQECSDLGDAIVDELNK
jgi:hypothetical protein